MYDPSKPIPFWNSPLGNLAKLAILLVALTVVIIVVSTALITDDWAWLSHDFTALPSRILIYRDGQITELISGRPGFDSLARAVRDSLATGVAQQSSTGLSDTSLQEARQRYTTVEAFFDEQVKVHAGFYTGHPTQMLFPITGRHSEWPIVFLGNGGAYEANAPVLNSNAPLLQALRALGYLP